MTDSSVNWKKERRDTILRYAPLVIWIGVILFLGSGQGSMTRTSIIIRPLLEFLFPSADELTLQLYHGYIRKLAHFTEYGVLAFLALRAFIGSATRYVAALVLVALIASIDEINQSFEVSRTSSAWDVLLDIAGGLFVVAVCYFRQRRSLGR